MPIEVRKVNQANKTNDTVQSGSGVKTKIDGSVSLFTMNDNLQKEQDEQAKKPLDEKMPKYIIKTMTEGSKKVLSQYKTENNQTIFKAATECKNGETFEHYYILDSDKRLFFEVDNDGKIVSGAKGIKPSELEKAVKNAADAAENSKELTKSYNKLVKTGYDEELLYNAICGWTTGSDYNDINDYIEKLDANNIMMFLEKYYDASKYSPNSGDRGLIENLDTEHDFLNAISMDNKLKPAKELCKVAEKLNLDGEKEYAKIKSILNRYETGGRYSGRQNLRGASYRGSDTRNGLFGGTAAVCGTIAGAAAYGAACGLAGASLTGPGALVGAAIGCLVGVGIHIYQRVTETGMFSKPDSAILDEAMYSLYEKIREKIGK